MRYAGLRLAGVTAVVIAAGLCATTADGEWRQTAGPVGGSTFVLGSDGDTVLTGGGGGGVFRSTDGGTSWSVAHDGLPLIESLTDLVPAGNDTWYASTYRDVFRSLDAGQTWESVGTSLDLTSISVRVFDGDAYAIGRNENFENELHVYYSPSQDWFPIATPDSVGSVLVEGAFMLASNDTAYFTKVMRSYNSGQTWEVYEDPNNFPVLGFSDLTRIGTAIVAISLGDGVWRSEDDGQTWTQIVESTELSATALLKLDGDLYVLDYSGQVHRSLDGGYTWTQLASGVPGIRDVAAHNGSLLVAAVRVYRSDDDGATWTESSDGIIATTVASIQTIGSDLAAVEAGQPGVHSSQDGGIDWQFDPAAVPSGVEVTTVFQYDANTLLLGTRYNGIYRSTNSGQTWTPANSGWPTYHDTAFSTAYHQPVQFLRVGDDIFVLGGGSREVIGGTIGQPHTRTSGAGVYLSTNQGQSWQAVRSGLPITMTNPLYGNPMYASGVRLAEFDGTLLVSLDGYGIYRSANLGSSWHNASTGLPLYNDDVWLRASAFYEADGAIIVADRRVNLVDPQVALYASYDNGLSWSVWSPGPGQEQGIVDVVQCGERLIVAVQPNYYVPESPTFFESSDDGLTWTPLAQNIPGMRVHDLHTDGTSLLAATDLGIWRVASHVQGDVNCDGALDFGDINAFVLVLTEPATYAAEHPTCDPTLADLNADGVVGFGDINPFVAALIGP